MRPAGLSVTQAKEQLRRRALGFSMERRDALLRSKRLRRMFEGTEEGDSGDALLSSVDAVTLLTAVNQAVQQAAASQASEQDRLASDLRYLRKLLSDSDQPPLDAVLDGGAVPVLVRALQPTSSSPQAVEAALEAGWVLAYLAGGDHAVAKEVLPSSPVLITQLSCAMGAPLAEVSAWALGNLAADCTEFSETLVANGAIRPLAELMFSAEKGIRTGPGGRDTVVAATTAAWALANLVRYSSLGADHLLAMSGAETHILELLRLEQPRIVTEVAWVLTYLLSRDNSSLDTKLADGAIDPLVGLLSTSTERLEDDVDNCRAVLTPVLRCLGNIAAGANVETAQHVISSQNGAAVRCMIACLKSSHRGLQKEATWTLSNIAGSPDKGGPTAVKNSGAVPVLLEMMRTSAFDVKKEVGFTLANICVGQEKEEPDVDFLRSVLSPEQKVLEAFLSFMKSPDMEAARLGVRFVEVVLRVIPKGPQIVEAADGIFALEELQFKGPEDLQKMAADLVDKYYGEDYGLQDDAL